jgi:sugar/nucleoside kinase (ribokinase family)
MEHMTNSVLQGGVLGMGNALVDVLIRIEDESMLERLKLPKGSMQLIDEGRMTEIMEATDHLPVVMVSGGSAANCINGLAKLGVPAGFIGSAGLDEWGDFYIRDMEHHGIRTRFHRSPSLTGRANGLVTNDSERTFGTYLGAAIELGPDFLKPEMFEGYSIFHIEGYMVQNYDLMIKSLELAHGAHCGVSIDLASYNVVRDHIEFLKLILPRYIDIVFANQEEAHAFTGKEPETALDELAGLCRYAIVKTGSDGAWVKSETEKRHIGSFKVDCMDTTGAGDLFASGFLYGLLQDKPPGDCGRMGNMLAAEVIQVMGPKIPDKRWPDIHKRIETDFF